MIKYEKPIINFNELHIFEKIADRCWAGGNVKFSDPLMGEDESPEATFSITKDGGCGEDEFGKFLDCVKGYYKYSQDQKVYNAWYTKNITDSTKNYQETQTQWSYFQVS